MRTFIRRLTALVDAKATTAEMMRDVPVALKPLLAGDAWLPPAAAVPHPDRYQQYLLYCDPAARFSVVSFVWGPGQETRIHDHTVWGAVGQLKGREVRNGSDGVSISIHVYGGDIGRIERHAYDPVTGAESIFVSGYSPAAVPRWEA
jgi:predicted metal-dependent enzyme (double-stranded beta helix superfamily)